MVVRIKLLSPLECKGHTLLQLLQRGLYQRLTLILMAKKKTETKLPHEHLLIRGETLINQSIYTILPVASSVSRYSYT